MHLSLKTALVLGAWIALTTSTLFAAPETQAETNAPASMERQTESVASGTHPIAPVTPEQHESTTPLNLILLTAAGSIALCATLTALLLHIYRDYNRRFHHPSSLEEIKIAAQEALFNYGLKHFGKRHFRIYHCTALNKWIIMKAEPQGVFMQYRTIDGTGITRIPRKSKAPLLSRAEIQDLFQTEALLVTLNPRRTHFEVHPCELRRSPVCSSDLRTSSLLQALAEAEKQGPFKLRSLPPGDWKLYSRHHR